MTLPFDTTKIDLAVERYKEYLHAIINSPLLTFDELRLKNESGIYLIFNSENELIYVGMTSNIGQRLVDLISSDFSRHTLMRNFLSFEFGDKLYELTKQTYISNACKKKLLHTLGKEEYNKHVLSTKEKIKKLRFKFFASNNIHLSRIEHFVIATLDPIYTQ